jgi:hypothetical protein
MQQQISEVGRVDVLRLCNATAGASVPASDKQSAVTGQSAQEPVQDNSTPDHYDSETDVEGTDDEMKDYGVLPDNLFGEERKPLSTIPKRASRPKRHVPLELEAGTSSRKVTRTAVESGHSRMFGTQDLLDDF